MLHVQRFAAFIEKHAHDSLVRISRTHSIFAANTVIITSLFEQECVGVAYAFGRQWQNTLTIRAAYFGSCPTIITIIKQCLTSLPRVDLT